MTHMPLDPPFHTIDLAPSLDAICSKYGDRYFDSLDAVWDAAALWGVTPESGHINQAGVFNAATVPLALRAGGCKAEVRVVQAPNGYWAMSTDYMTAISGSVYAPSVWNCTAFPSIDDARLAGIHELIARLEGEFSSTNSCNTDSNRRNVRALIAKLEAEKRPQLSLF